MAHPDLDKLPNVLLPFAQEMLQKHGEFYPFAASMHPDGTTGMVGAKIDGNDFPDSEDLIAILEAALRRSAEAGKIKASGICMDVRVRVPRGSETTDAIEACLEHAEAGAVNVFLPYQKGLLKKVNYGQIFAPAADPKIFAPLKKH